MDLKIEGRVIQILEEQSGEGRNGPWRKREFILETEGKYPKKVCITQWGDEIDQSDVAEGDQLAAYIDIQSREYNGRWYTDVKAWKIERGGAQSGGAVPGGDMRGAASGGGTGTGDTDADDDLPF